MRDRELASLKPETKAELNWKWRGWWARPSQVAPPGEWTYWLFMAGRGAGKTRSGAEWVREKIKAGCGHVGLISPTAGDARAVMVDGESGILNVCWQQDRNAKGNLVGKPLYEPSKRLLTWENGAKATTFSAEEPERLRGPQHDALWCDELAAWKYLRETWDMAMFGLRLGAKPQAMITTTPRPVSLLREMLKDEATVVSRGSTFENAANLAPSYIAKIRTDYEGTRLGRQELYAELLDEAEGALWSRDMIEASRYRGDLPEMKRVVVAIDPAVTKTDASDETGIIGAGLGMDDRGYVLRDVSGRYSPAEWARKAIRLFHELGADRLIAEGNNGGDMVRHTLQTEWNAAPVTMVHASRGKAARAEPVSALYEQSRVRHVGPALETLEDQLVTWEPLSGMPSPDRLDALVWAMTSLMVRQQASTSTSTVVGLM